METKYAIYYQPLCYNVASKAFAEKIYGEDFDEQQWKRSCFHDGEYTYARASKIVKKDLKIHSSLGHQLISITPYAIKKIDDDDFNYVPITFPN